MSLFSHILHRPEIQLPDRLRPMPVPALAPPADVVQTSDTPADSVAPAGEHDASKARGIFSKIGSVARDLFVPTNMPNSVSKDYLVTRKWQLARDLAGNVSWGFAAGMAVSAATMPGLLAVGMTLFTYGLVKDRLTQVAGLAASTMTPMAARNPRAWLLGGDILDSAGVAMMSTVALVPGLFVPASIGIALMQTFAGTMKGAAGADIGRRQATSDNLGELNAKNGNQGLLVNNAGLLIGGALSFALTSTLGVATLPIIGAVGAGIGIWATSHMLKNLDMNPVNETAVRQLVDEEEKGEKVAGPDKDHPFKALAGLWHTDKIQLGQDVELLKKDPQRFAELKTLYKDRNYLMESVAGKPYAVLKPDCTPEDRFQALYQGVTMEHLKAGDDYKAELAKDGQDKADFWLVQQSLAKTPADVKPLLAQMKDAGWSTDLLRPWDTGKRPTAAQLA